MDRQRLSIVEERGKGKGGLRANGVGGGGGEEQWGI